MKPTYLTTLLSTTGIFLLLVIVMNAVVDPMRYYHQPWLDIGFSENQRFQNPGLVRTADYDIVLIGTSHTELVTTEDMNQALGGKSLNLSMSGSLITEQMLLLDLVLESGKAKRVLWEINYPSFSLGDMIPQPESFPMFLFQPGVETPFRYLVSWETLNESFQALSGQRIGSLDELNRWDLYSEFGEERVMAHWDFLAGRWSDELRDVWSKYEVTRQELVKLVKEQVMAAVQKYPEVQFDLLFLPTSMLNYATDFQVSADQHGKRLFLRNEIARQADGIANARLWDFQLPNWMSYEFAHYKDVEHFDQQVIQSILGKLSDPRKAVSAEQLVSDTEVLRQEILNYSRQFCRDHEERCQAALKEGL